MVDFLTRSNVLQPTPVSSSITVLKVRLSKDTCIWLTTKQVIGILPDEDRCHFFLYFMHFQAQIAITMHNANVRIPVERHDVYVITVRTISDVSFS